MKILCAKKVLDRPPPSFKATAFLVDVRSGARIGKFQAYDMSPTVAARVDIACSVEAGKQRAGVECTETELVFLANGPDPAELHDVAAFGSQVVPDVFFMFTPPFEAA